MIFLLLFIERTGRKRMILIGGSVMTATMLINASVLATHPTDQGFSSVSAASVAMIVMIYLFCVAYSGSWGPVPWTYIG